MTANPVDDATFTRPLIKALQQHVDAIAAGITGLPAGSTSVEAADERTAVAASWVYLSVLVAWAEDHHLIDPWLRAAARPDLAQFLDISSAGAPGYLAHAVHDLARHHPATWALLDPRYTRMRDGRLPAGPVRALLDWWAEEAPSFRFEVDAGPGSLSGWLPGDLLQQVSAHRRKANALVQTPWWVADFINNLTIRPAIDEFRATPVIRMIDPTCGTGHMLIRAVDLLWSWYTIGEIPADDQGGKPVTGGTPVGPGEAARRILAGLDGVELDPLTAAVARLRITVAVAGHLVAAGALPGPLRLDRIPHSLRPRIVVGDSLLLGEMPWEEYRELYGPERGDLAAIYESETELFGSVRWPDETPAEPHAVIRPRDVPAGEQLDLLALEAAVPP